MSTPPAGSPSTSPIRLKPATSSRSRAISGRARPPPVPRSTPIAPTPALGAPPPPPRLYPTSCPPIFPWPPTPLPRLAGPAELAELGFDDLPEGAVVLLEWPDRADGFLPPDRLDVSLTLAPKLKL